MINTGTNTSKCSDGSFVGKSSDISDFGHQVRSERCTNTFHCHNNRVFGQFGCGFIQDYIRIHAWISLVKNADEVVFHCSFVFHIEIKLTVHDF